MKIIRKGLAVLLTLVMLVGALPMYALAADSPRIVLEPQKETVSPGDEYSVKVYFEAGNSEVSLAGIELYFTYDKDRLTPDSLFAFDRDPSNRYLMNWSMEVGTKTPGLITIAGGTAQYYIEVWGRGA